MSNAVVVALAVLFTTPSLTAFLQNDHGSLIDRHSEKNWRYLSNPVLICENELFLLVVVCSGVDHFEQRAVIRDTWGTIAANRSANTKVVFMLGIQSDISWDLDAKLADEIYQNNDIIQESFEDSYANLSLKTMRALHWIHQHCSQTVFVLKTDDDVFINIPVLLKDLHNTVHKRFIMGATIAGAEPIRDKTSKWYTPVEKYNETRYPTYVSGSAYIISGDAVSDLYNVSSHNDLFWLEDVFITGMCAEMAGVKHLYNGKFGYKKRLLSPCLFKLIITAHRINPEQMRKVWRELQKPDLYCDYLRVHLDMIH